LFVYFQLLRAAKLMTRDSFDTLGFLSSEGELLLWKSQVYFYFYVYSTIPALT